MVARIVAYTYANGNAYGLPHPAFNATATLGVVEQGTPGTTTYVRPTTPKPFYAPEEATDQLRNWDTGLDAHTPAGYYSVTYSPTTKRVTIASTNSTAFRPVMVEAGAVWSGFTQDLSSGWALSWTAEDPPAAVCELIAVTVEPAEDSARVDLHEYRQGRAVAVAWGNHQVHKVTLYVKAEDLRALDPGYLVTGRVRIIQGPDTTPYSATNPDGVVDGYVIASTDPAEDGDVGEVWTVNLLVGVPR